CLLFISLLLLYLTSLLFPYTTLFRSLKFIEDAINKYIISQFGDMYVFVFVGGDTQTEAEIIDMLEKKAKIGYTINDIREEFGKPDRKSTRLNSSHVSISYAVFCLKKK